MIIIIIIIIIVIIIIMITIKRLWELRCAKVVPVVIGALGSVTKDLECWIEKMDIVPEVGVLQKTALLGTARILRKVLEP